MRHLKHGLNALMAASAALCAGTALAADASDPTSSSIFAQPPAPVPAFSWTGFYVGVNGGVGADHFGVPSTIFWWHAPLRGFTGIWSKGPVLGAGIGYNYEITDVPIIGHMVLGVEGDADWEDLTGSNTIGTALGAGTFGTHAEWFGTLRGRIGYNFDRLLIYLTGGLTAGSFNSYYTVGGYSGSQNVTCFKLPPHSLAGGIGAEYALTDNISVKAEYFYDGILSQWDQIPSNPPGIKVGLTTRSDYSIIRLGVNYKLDLFSPPAPVIAKY